MKYSELHYERISVEEQNDLLNERLERFNDAASADEQVAVIKEVDQTRRENISYFAMASLNFKRDLRDEAAKAEKEYYDSILPAMEEIDNRWKEAVVASKFKEELKQEWVLKAIERLVADMEKFPTEVFSDGGLYHAAHALLRFREATGD